MSTTTNVTGSSSPPIKRKPSRFKAKDWVPYLFVSPFFILFAIFGLFPLLFSGYVSFFRWDGFGEMKWTGFGNYLFALQLDDIKWAEFFTKGFWEDMYTRDFWRSLFNTVWIGLASGIPQHLIAIPLAYFIHTRLRRMRSTVLAVYFLPFITNTVAVALVFNAMFSRDFGVFNTILTGIGHFNIAGIEPLSWLFPTNNIDFGRPETQRWTVAFLVWWRYVGWNTVLYIGALQTIPKDLYEAARIDGASGLQQFRYITLPLLRPMMFFAVTLTIIGNLQLFEEPYIMTGPGGGINGVAQTSAMYMLSIGNTDGDFGAASAIAWLLFIFIALLTYLNHKIFKPKD
jgi:multiple sugar transport system permease protein